MKHHNKIKNVVMLMALSTIGMGSLVAHAEVFKWTDANGVIHYSDKAPQASKITSKVFKLTAAEEEDFAEENALKFKASINKPALNPVKPVAHLSAAEAEDAAETKNLRIKKLDNAEVRNRKQNFHNTAESALAERKLSLENRLHHKTVEVNKNSAAPSSPAGVTVVKMFNTSPTPVVVTKAPAPLPVATAVAVKPALTAPAPAAVAPMPMTMPMPAAPAPAPTSSVAPTTAPTTNGLTINSGLMNMPVVNAALIPASAPGKGFLDLIPHQPGIVPTYHADFPNGEFRVVCHYSHMLNDDPITKPGKPGTSHLHTFFGNSNANAFSTTPSLMASGNSTCDGGTMNRSAYWVPSVIDTRTGAAVAPSGGNFYYKTENSTIVKMPPIGLRMIAGNMYASSEQADSKLVWWCGDPSDNNSNPTVTDKGMIPSCPVGNHLMAVVRFPNFWDGVNLDSPDHKSHVSYIHDAAHPVEIPDVTFNVRYDILPGQDVSKWRLSSDMYDKSIPGGYSLHGDYMFGWTTDPVSGKNFAQIFTEDCLQARMNCGNALLGDGRQFQY